MLEFLKKLLGFSLEKFGMGMLPSPEDSRNIPIGQVQGEVPIPYTHITDISMLGVNNQGSKPRCVGESITKIAEYYVFKKTGEVVKFDPEALYKQCKLEDGIPEVAGTYATVAIKIAVRDGIDKIGKDSNDKFADGYAFVPNNLHAIANAIFQNGMVTIGLMINSNWFKGIIGKALSSIGGHQVSLHGYSITEEKVFGINSWGTKWIGNIAGYIDGRVKPGFFVALFDDIRDSVINIIAIVPIPKEILEDAKNSQYIFVTDMKIGSSGFEVSKLQERFGIIPTTGYFGSITKSKVIDFQRSKGLPADGAVGPMTRAELNKKSTSSKLDLWCEGIKEHEGWFAGSRSYRNKNPGNLKYVGQRRAVGKDSGGFCIFASYEDGFNELKEMLVRAGTPPDTGVYRANMTLLEFFRKYAPSADNNNPDNYAKVVARKIGVGIDVPISSLI